MSDPCAPAACILDLPRPDRLWIAAQYRSRRSLDSSDAALLEMIAMQRERTGLPVQLPAPVPAGDEERALSELRELHERVRGKGGAA